MAKIKIISSFSLECLTSGLQIEIEEADNQIIIYENELEREKQHRQNEKSIKRATNQKHDWLLRRDVLHQCLCKIQMQIKEIEI